MSKPYGFQQKGVEWLAPKKRALLADEMGLGKSVQSILAAVQAGCRRILVICPAIARMNWANEVRMWAPVYAASPLVKLKARVPAEEGWAIGIDDRVFTIASYEFAVHNRERLAVDHYEWDCVIVDEAQALGNPWAQRTAAVLGGNSICAHTRRLWHLTGTPISTHPDQLWALAYEAQVTSLSFRKWCEHFCDGYFDGREFKVVQAKKSAMDELHELLTTPRLNPDGTWSPWMLRRMEGDADVEVQLPPIRHHELVVEPTKLTPQQVAEQWPDYSDDKVRLQQKLHLEEELVKHAIGEANALDADKIKALEGLAGSVSTLRWYTGLQKVPAVADLVAQELGADEYRKIVIFFEHRPVGEALHARLAGFGAHLLYGGLPAARKDAFIADFQRRDGGARVILVQYQTGATAINLQVASQLLAIEIPWTGAAIQQAIKRVHRIGSKDKVTVRYAMLADSYDKVVMTILQRRAREISHILDGAPRELLVDKDRRPAAMRPSREVMLG